MSYELKGGQRNKSGPNQFGETNTVGVQPAPATETPDTETPATDTPATNRSGNVFVVYGRDEQVRDAVFGLLRKLALRPLEWEPLVHATGQVTPFLGQVVADALTRASAAVVVLTPDDEVRLHPDLYGAAEDPHELTSGFQARPNVLLELGLALGTYPENTIILEFGRMRPIADLAGRNVIRLNQGTPPLTAIKKIAGRLKAAGCPVDDAGGDWLDPTPFTDLAAYRRCP